MAPRIIVLSGPVAGGKSKLADALQSRFSIQRVKTQDVIVELTSVARDRRALQQAGEKLDRATDGAWVARALTRVVTADPDADAVTGASTWILVDSARIPSQIEHVRKAFGLRVVH